MSAAPTWAVLGGIVLVGWLLIGIQTVRTSGWFIQTDELQNVRLAMSAADALSPVPTIHGVHYGGVSQLYSLVMAPVFGLFGTPRAFDVAHAVNALLMASAAIPAYLLSREVVRSRAAGLVAAALSIALPWMVVALPVWGESLAYPVFLWAMLAMQRAVVEPSWRRDALALLAILLAFLTRTQFLVLALGFPVAVVIHEAAYALVADGAGQRVARARAALIRAARGHALLVGIAVVALLGLVAVGIGPLLGPYRTTVGQGDLLPPGTLRQTLIHVAIVGVGTGALPFVVGLAWLLSSVLAPRAKAAHAYAALVLVVGVGLYVQAATFVVRFAAGLPQDRYFFYLVPLVFIAAAGWLLEGPRRVVSLVAAVALFGWALTKWAFPALPANYVLTAGSVIDLQLQGRVGQVRDALGIDFISTVGLLRLLIVVFVLGGGLLLVRFRAPRVIPGLAVAALAFMLATSVYAFHKARAIEENPKVGDFVDRAVGGQPVGMLSTETSPGFEQGDIDTNRYLWWTMEFRNRSIKRDYQFAGSPGYTPFPRAPLAVDSRTGAVSGPGLTRYMVQATRQSSIGLRGKRVASSAPFTLLDIGERPRARWTVSNLAGGLPAVSPGLPVTLRAFPDSASGGPRRLTLTFGLTTPPKFPVARQRYNLTVGGRTQSRTFRRLTRRVVRVSRCVDGPMRVRLTTGAIGVPTAITRVGLILDGVRVTEAPGRCG